MNRVDTRSPDQFLSALLAELSEGYASEVVFRGERDCYPTILPSALRHETDSEDGLELAYFAATYLQLYGGAIQTSDGRMLRAQDAWEDRLEELRPFVRSTYLYSLAQHHGLSTHLLDVTSNPLVAAYFAVDYAKNDDVGDKVRIVVVGERDVGLSSCGLLRVPPHANTRLHRQGGAFLTHAAWDRGKSISLPDLESCREITLDGRFADPLRLMLQRMGFSPTTMYGDLDAVASEARWRAKAEHMMLTEPPKDDGIDMR